VVDKSRAVTVNKITPIPTHVAIIMDGNGRWAKQRGLPRLADHKAGTDNVQRVVERFDDYGVKYLTLFAFSTENWRRPDEEINGLFRILAEMIDRETRALHKKNAKLRHLGRIDSLDKMLQEKIHKAIELTKNNTGINLSVAFDYGGRAEILDAIRRMMKDGVPPEEVNESLFHRYLYTPDVPEPDLIVRTGGEMRLSNFLIWEAAYSEFYSTTTLWPDFTDAEIEKALVAYSQRERRFGGLIAEGEAKRA